MSTNTLHNVRPGDVIEFRPGYGQQRKKIRVELTARPRVLPGIPPVWVIEGRRILKAGPAKDLRRWVYDLNDPARQVFPNREIL